MILFDWEDNRWKRKNGSQLFEGLCFQLLMAMGFKDVDWRKGSFDKGRDIVCFSESKQPDGSSKRERWFCGCKCYSGAINKDTIRNEIDWADAEQPDYLLIITQSHITPQTKEWIDTVNQKHGKPYEIKYWERGKLQMYIEQYEGAPNIVGFFPEKELDLLIQKVREASLKAEDKYLAHVQRTKKDIASLNSDTDTVKLISKYELLYELAESSNKPYQAANYLEQAFSASKKLGSNKRGIEISRKLGEVYLVLGWHLVAETQLLNAYKAAKEIGDDGLLADVSYSLGKAYHAGSVFDDAKHHYVEAHDLFRSLNEHGKAASAEVSIATLALDFDDEPQFQNLADALQVSLFKKRRYFSKALDVELQVILARLFMQMKAFEKASKVINAAKSSLKRQKVKNHNGLLRILLEEAHLAYLNDDKESAIKILEEECLEVARGLQDEQQIMLILRQSSFIRTFRERPSSSYAEDWEARSRANDLGRKFESDFSRARQLQLDAAWSLARKEFRDSLIALNHSRQSFRMLGDFIDEMFVKREMTSLHESVGNLLAALDDAIEIGQADRALKMSEELAATLDKKEIARVLGSLIALSSLSTVQRVAVAATFEGLSQVVPDEYVGKVVSRLIELSTDHFSLTSNFDVRRRALTALVQYSMMVDEKDVFGLLDLLRKFSAPDEFWQVRSLCIQMYTNLCRPFAEDVMERLLQDVLELLNTLKLGNPNYRDTIILGAKLCNRLKDPRKDKLLKVLSSVLTEHPSLLGVDISVSLGFDLPHKTVEEWLMVVLNQLDQQVIIENKSVREQPAPTPKGFGMYHTRPLGDNRRITVSEGADFTLFGVLGDNFPDSLRPRLITSIMRNIKNEHNSIMNKYGLIALLGQLQKIIPEGLVSDVIRLLLEISSGQVLLSTEQMQEIKQASNPFSSGRMSWGLPEDLISIAITTMTSYFKVMDSPSKEKALGILLEQARSDNKSVRKAVAYGIRDLNLIDEPIQLSLLLLTNDPDLDVAASAAPTFALVSDRLDDQLRIEGIDRICSRAALNSLGLRLTTATALGELLKKPWLDSTRRQIILEGLTLLTHDKYFSVRHHAREIQDSFN